MTRRARKAFWRARKPTMPCKQARGARIRCPPRRKLPASPEPRYVATPMRRSDFLLALTSSRLVLMIAELGLLLGFGIFVFHMRVAGSWLAIVLLGALGAAAFAGLGLLTASRAQKIESVSGLINLVMMPMWVFSGVFFSYERFPAVVHPLIRALPLTALNDALRATILEGAPLAAQAGRLAVLLAWTAVSFLLALSWFRWT